MEYFIFMLVVLLSSIGHAFLLTNSTQSGLASFEFQQLSQMINNEGLSRHHVENEVTSLEQRVAEIESDLKTKYDERMNDFKAAVEKKINATKAEFEQELNTTKLTLEQLSHALEKEKSNSRQLEREYARLMIDFRNLSMKYDSLVAKETDLSTRMEKINGSFNLIHRDMVKNSFAMASNAANISSLTATTALLNTKAGYKSAFTVMGPTRNGTYSHTGPTMIFTNVKYDIGGHYNTSSGTFKCVYSGIYLFMLHIYKTPSSKAAWCRIWKNDFWNAVVSAEPQSSATWYGLHEGSGSAVIHLVRGDIVSAGDCTPANTIHAYSSFAGVLLQPD